MKLAKKYYVDKNGDMIGYTRYCTADKVEQSAESFHAKLKIVRVGWLNSSFCLELQNESRKTYSKELVLALGYKTNILRGENMSDMDYSYLANYISCDDTIKIKVPKVIARIKICGGGLTFTITDDMQFEMPTKEQCENLKKTFGIEVEWLGEE